MTAAAYLADPALRRAFLRGIDLGEFERSLENEIVELRRAVELGAYWAWPLRKVEVEKRPGSAERRTLLVPAVRDRVLQTAVAAYLEPILEPEFEECSFAYRRGRSVRMAVEKVYALYHQGYRWVLDADIDAFFDSVDRAVVLGRLATHVHDELVIRLARLWLDYAIWDGSKITRLDKGIPQGAVISPMLANLCLDRLDERLQVAGFSLVRYADDFVVLAKKESHARDALEITEKTLDELRLKLHTGKTRVARFTDGFKFLGVVFFKDMLLQPFKNGRRRLRVYSSAPPLPPAWFPASERRMLRRYPAM
jgi:group II intron reverse transcriptase/maturase